MDYPRIKWITIFDNIFCYEDDPNKNEEDRAGLGEPCYWTFLSRDGNAGCKKEFKCGKLKTLDQETQAIYDS